MLDNSFFNRFDRSSFRSFYVSANELSFTKAAKKCGVTQSGISQHIAKLEAELGVSLFLRLKTKLVLTDAGKILLNYLEKIYTEEEIFLELLAVEESSLEGRVRYSMPGSCLISPHFKMMLEVKQREFVGVDLSVDIYDSEMVVNNVLVGISDFGFVTTDIEHPQIDKIEFCHESYVLIKGKHSKYPKGEFGELPFIDHPDFSSLFEVWYKKQFPRRKGFSSQRLNFSGETNRLKAGLEMVAGGLGVTVVPVHCVAEYIDSKEIELVKGFKPASGKIHIIFRKGKVLPRRVRAVINTFLGFYDQSLETD